MIDTRTETFTAHRAHLLALAYRMLGMMVEAEDIVQECYLRWQKASRDEIRSPKAWLTTATTRLCLTHLKSARMRRMVYFGPWLPEPMITEPGVEPPPSEDPREHAQLADSVSLALLVVLESLSPTERAVFVLREVFDHEFSEIARVVGKTEVNCRRILARARDEIAEHRPHLDTASPQRDRVFDQFTLAVRTGDLRGLLGVLSEDVTFVSDGGGRARALPVALTGARRVAQLIAAVMQRLVPPHRVYHRVSINGLPGIVGCEEGKVVQVLAAGIADGRVSHIYIITNPAKLRAVETYMEKAGRNSRERS